jgi:hypothetical protein
MALLHGKEQKMKLCEIVKMLIVRFAGLVQDRHGRDRRLLAALLSMVVCLLYVAVLPAQAVTPPTISPSTGSFTISQLVTMSAPAGTIYYTLDGSNPTTSGTAAAYSAGFYVNGPVQINAAADQSGTWSAVTTNYLDVDASLAPVLQSGLVLRLRAGLGVTTSGSAVSSWADLSGSGNNATGSGIYEPTFTSSAVAGLPAVTFSGSSSQYLSLPSGFSNFTNGATLFVVTQPTNLTANSRIIDLGQGSSGNNLLMQIASSGSTGQFSTYSGTSGTSAQTPCKLYPYAYQFLQANLAPSTTTGTSSFNGVAGTANTSMNTLSNVSRTANYIGQASSTGNYFTGSIAELLLFNTNLSSGQSSAILNWLMNKYQVFTPLISVPTSTLNGPTQVMVYSRNGAQTFITTDGSVPDPTNVSQQYYGAPITINYTQTLNAISVFNGTVSGMASSTYTLDSTQWPPPGSSATAPSINLQLPSN